jgi:hypothetical protein
MDMRLTDGMHINQKDYRESDLVSGHIKWHMEQDFSFFHEYVVSSRIRSGRSICGLALPPGQAIIMGNIKII